LNTTAIVAIVAFDTDLMPCYRIHGFVDLKLPQAVADQIIIVIIPGRKSRFQVTRKPFGFRDNWVIGHLSQCFGVDEKMRLTERQENQFI
jgi:hypothetical protein